MFTDRVGRKLNTVNFSNQFIHLATKAGVQATFKQLRKTSAEAVRRAVFDQGIEPSLVNVHLAHKDGTTMKWYVTDDPTQFRVPALEPIVLGLQRLFGLEWSPK